MRKVLTLFLIWAFAAAPQAFAQQKNNEPTDKAGSSAFRQGQTLYLNGQYQEAINRFDVYLDGSPDGRLGETARYYKTRAMAAIDSANTALYYEQYVQRYPSSSRTDTLLIELGKRFERRKKYEQALQYYQEALDHKLSDRMAVKVYYWMAETSVDQGNADQGRRYFLELAQRYPDSEWAPKALYARGRLYLNEHNFSASSEAFELLREKFPNDPMTRRVGTALGESYYQKHEYQKAIEALKDAMPNLEGEARSKAVYLVAESYNFLDNYDEASKYYLQYINLNKGSGNVRLAHYGLGWVYYKQDIYHWASDEFGKAAEGDDDLARKAQYYKAVNEKLGGRYEKALESFRTFGDRYKKGTWVETGYYEWAVTAYEMGAFSEAIEVLRSLVNSDRELQHPGKTYLMLGKAYFSNNEYTRAIQAFDAAEGLVDVDQNMKRQARFQKAWVLYRNQAYEQAQPLFEQVYNEAPNDTLAAEALFWSADSYYHMKKYEPAANRFAAFIQRYPDNEMLGAARYSLGWSYFQMGQYDKAVKPMKDFLQHYNPPKISLYPYDTDTELRVGDSYYAMGDYQEAISYYQQAIGAEPGGDYAMFQIANSNYRAENSYDAVQTFRKMLRIYPYSSLREQAQYNIAYIYFLTNNYSQAVEEFNKVIEKYPNTNWAARSQYSIGDAYYNAGQYDKAIAAYKKVLDEYPQSDYIIDAVNGVQYCQLAAGKKDTSTELLENFLAKHPRTGMADRLRYRKADNLLQSGNYEQAIKELKQYIRITNSDDMLPDAYASLAEAYRQTDNLGQAIEAYRTIVDQYENSDKAASALASLGRIEYERGNYQASRNYFQQLAQKEKGMNTEAYIGMANADLKMGNIDAARNQYEQALKSNESNDQGRLGLGKVELKKGNYGKAREVLGKIAEENTTEIGAEAQYLVGKSYQDQGNYGKALDAYSKVKVLYEAYANWVSQSMLDSAVCYLEQGETERARSTLNEIIDNYAGTDAASRARKLLNENES